MPHYRVDSEYKPLKAVLLCRPQPQIQAIACPADVLHSGKIDHAEISREYDELVKVYKKFKIKVFFISPRKIKGTDDSYIFNLIYVRDLFFMTTRGAILSKMAIEVRRDEVRYAKRALGAIDAPVRGSIQGSATFEGADALWVNSRLAVVGVGNRTNTAGFSQIKKELSRDGIQCVCVPAPKASIHLLGALQLVDSDLALARIDLISPVIPKFLKKNKIEVVNIGESDEVAKKQAMNFVTIAPRKIIMPAGCPRTKKIYERSGIKVAAEVEAEELVKGAGGLACATGILTRETLS
jgi:N-dimethylarginine dimethylaminohydrolase